MKSFKRIAKEQRCKFQPFFFVPKLPSMRKKHAIKEIYGFRAFHGGVNFSFLKQVALKVDSHLTMSLFKPPYYYECHLPMVIYRMNLVNTIFQAKKMVATSNILVNGVAFCNTNTLIKAGDYVNPERSLYLTFYKNVRTLLRQRKIHVNTPEYLLYNVRILRAVLWRYPYFGEAPYSYPFGVVLASGIPLHYY